MSHGDCLDGLITGTITYLELDCCTGTVLGCLGMVTTSYSLGSGDCQSSPTDSCFVGAQCMRCTYECICSLPINIYNHHQCKQLWFQ